MIISIVLIIHIISSNITMCCLITLYSDVHRFWGSGCFHKGLGPVGSRYRSSECRGPLLGASGIGLSARKTLSLKERRQCLLQTIFSTDLMTSKNSVRKVQDFSLGVLR